MWNAYDSPQMRRLRSDAAVMSRLCEESSIVRVKSGGSPARRYLVEFHGKSLTRESGKIATRIRHQVEIKLGASYPRAMPELRWLTPIFHPNISEIGMVCLGGYGTHWVPSLRLDALCAMLWDMARYFNYDIRSPYNRDAALWVANQSTFAFPMDARPLRDLRVARGRIETPSPRPVAVAPKEESPPEDTTVPFAEHVSSEPDDGNDAKIDLIIVDAPLRPTEPVAVRLERALIPQEEEIVFLSD